MEKAEIYGGGCAVPPTGTILRFLEDHQDRKVQMVCFDGRTRNAYEEAFKDWG